MASGETSAQERTEQPTAHRREQARRRGQVARSADLGPAAALLGALGVWAFAGAGLLDSAVPALARALAAPPTHDLTPARALALGLERVRDAATLLWPFVLVPAAAAVGVQLAQTRFVLAPGPLAPDWSRLDPRKGLQRLLGLRSLAELVKAVLKLAVVGTLAWTTLSGAWPTLLALGQTGVAALPATLGGVLWDLALGVGVASLGLAGLDYGWQWWQHERGLRMSRQEVKDETRQTEGDPLLRGRLRQLHRQRVSRRLLAEVRRADVVVRNPTHFAVALRYEGGRMRAPRVVAKGARLVALRIIETARRHGVPVLENPPLARTLFRLVKVGGEVPPTLYRAVAEVLAHVYALRGPAR